MSWYRDLKRDVWKYTLVGILMISISLTLYSNSMLTNSLANINTGSCEAAISFSSSLDRATSFLNVHKPEEINISIQAFTDLGQGALEALRTLTYLNPANERTLRPVKDSVITLFAANNSNSFTVSQVLEQLREASSTNASAAISAITELRETTSQKIREMGSEVAEAFTTEAIDTSRLDRAVNLANELETTLNEWISQHS